MDRHLPVISYDRPTVCGRCPANAKLQQTGRGHTKNLAAATEIRRTPRISQEMINARLAMAQMKVNQRTSHGTAAAGECTDTDAAAQIQKKEGFHT